MIHGSTTTNHLRPDWLRDLTQRLGADVSEVTQDQRTQLQRLQGAAEQFEAVFVKRLVSEMRKSFMPSSGPMADLANEQLDESLSKSLAEGPTGFGLARSVFLSTAEAFMRTRPTNTEQENHG
jgi:Rod binding domain-containing protein